MKVEEIKDALSKAGLKTGGTRMSAAAFVPSPSWFRRRREMTRLSRQVHPQASSSAAAVAQMEKDEEERDENANRKSQTYARLNID